MLDLLIKNGTVADGSGGQPRVADIAVKDGTIVDIAPSITRAARTTIDAHGKLVTPGFIDVHTHFDGQVTWDDQLLPSSAHGVTTVVLGNCGIGFAPVRKGSEDWLVKITEGVEDIPGSALHDGIRWEWETFPEYLDVLGRREFAVDVAAQVPHSAVRAYVMGERAEADEAATEDEIEEMARIVAAGIGAGAVGVATSRMALHRTSDGDAVPGTRAPEDELLAMAFAMRDAGGGVFQIVPSGTSGGVEGQSGEGLLSGVPLDQYSLSTEVEMMRRLHQKTGQTITFTLAENHGLGPAEFDTVRDLVADAKRCGERLHPQFSPRAIGGLVSLVGYHPFLQRPSYRALAHLPVQERAQRMSDPEVKARILAEDDIPVESADPRDHFHVTLQRHLADTYRLDGAQRVDYEPHPSTSIAAQAEAAGVDPLALCYDLLIDDEGSAVLIWLATGYVSGDLSRVEDYLSDDQYIMGLGDAGAHVQFICDASFPTFLLSHWGLHRTRGRRFPIETLVCKLTKDPADLYGFTDRGVLQPGRRADINVIDLEALALLPPHSVNDLPSGAGRFLQSARGFCQTIVAGVITRENDADTGLRPGRLYRARTPSR
ncbi:N-acyl-D-amino-acid deacylase family protein [Mycolicibacterium thermoresistibile]